MTGQIAQGVQSAQFLAHLAQVGKKGGNTHISQDAGKNGNSREILVVSGNYWEICY